MKYYDLDREEKKILADYEAGKLRPATGAKRKAKVYQQVARLTLAKTKNINIRLPERDLLKLKSKAAYEGIPYQTLVASILHRTIQVQLSD